MRIPQSKEIRGLHHIHYNWLDADTRWFIGRVECGCLNVGVGVSCMVPVIILIHGTKTCQILTPYIYIYICVYMYICIYI